MIIAFPSIVRRFLRSVGLPLRPRTLAEISTLELLELLKKPQKDDKIETTHRLLQHCRAIFQETASSGLIR